MRIKEGSVCLVTGASSGIGKAIADTLAAEGMRVYGTSRNPVTIPSTPVTMLPLTLSDQASIEAAVAEIIAREGQIDCLINNAGSGICGAIEETSLEKIREQLNCCFLGHVAVTKAVLPLMRKQGGGRIVNTGFVAGFVPIPFQTWYSASKAAVQSYTMAMGNELRPFGITLTAVLPGDTKTGFTAARQKIDDPDGLYGGRIERSVMRMEQDEQNGVPAQKVGELIAKVALKKRVKPLYIPGFSYNLINVLMRILPSGLANRLIGVLYAK